MFSKYWICYLVCLLVCEYGYKKQLYHFTEVSLIILQNIVQPSIVISLWMSFNFGDKMYNIICFKCHQCCQLLCINIANKQINQSRKANTFGHSADYNVARNLSIPTPTPQKAKTKQNVKQTMEIVFVCFRILYLSFFVS